MNFAYRAYTGTGREEAGTIEAADIAEASRQLAAKGRRPFELKPSMGGVQRQPDEAKSRWSSLTLSRGPGRLSQPRLFLDLAILTEAGMTLTQALRALLASETVPAQRQAIETISSNMSHGRSAAEAFSLVQEISPETVALVGSGERSSQMPAALRALATQMAERERRIAEFRNALAYPAFLLVMMLVALSVVIFVLVPSLTPIFENTGQPPPTVIQVLDGMRQAVSDPLVQLVGIALAIGVASLGLPTVRKALAPTMQRFALSLPLVGTAIHKANGARYLNSLSLLIGGGTPMTDALAIAARSNPLHALRVKLEGVRDHVAAGERLPVALSHTRQFNSKIISLLAVGDEVNRLPVVLSRASAILDEESKKTMERLVAAVTPTVTIILGLLIGGLVVSVMTALLSINDLAVQG